MRSRRRRLADIELYPTSHLQGILIQRAGDKPPRAALKRIADAFRRTGAFFVYPLLRGQDGVRRALMATHLRLRREDVDPPSPLPYLRPGPTLALPGNRGMGGRAWPARAARRHGGDDILRLPGEDGLAAQRTP